MSRNLACIARNVTVALLTVAIGTGGIGSANAAPIAINLSASFQLSGGGSQLESGVISIDPETGLFSGSVDSNGPMPFNAIIPIIIACILVCKYIYPKEKVPPGPSAPKQSLFQQANGDIESAMTTDFGLAGTAVFSSHLFGNSAIITGDLTGTDLLLLPAMPSDFTVNASARTGGAGPGMAAGTSTVELLGLSISNVYSHTLLGNMNALVLERSITSELRVVSTGPTSYALSGQATAILIPEPSVLSMLTLSIGMLLFQRRRLKYGSVSIVSLTRHFSTR